MSFRRALPLSLAAGSLGLAGCIFSSDREGFSIEIGANAWNLRHHASEERTFALDLAEGDVLVMAEIQGDVTVRAASGHTPELVALLEADGRTTEEADEALRRTEVRIERHGNEVHVRVVQPVQKIELDQGVTLHLSPQSDLSATVPPGIEVRVGSTSGDIDLTGPLGSTQAETAYGNVSVTRVKGNLLARSGSGDVEIHSTQEGDVTAETNFGDVSLESVRGGRVLVISSSGDLDLRDVIGASIEARSSYGGIDLAAISGNVSADTASGDVELEDARDGVHELHSGFGRIQVERASGTLHATSESGDIAFEECRGEVTATSGFGSVEIQGVLSRVLAESGSGDVTINAYGGSAPASDWRIVSRFGSVELSLPNGFGCDIDARTDFGEVECDLPLFDRVVEEDGAILSGRLGDGGPRVELHTSSGDVDIQRQDS
ncbi:MAG: DUF4097 family beta strand repeat-containing protein [Planctomycetota bacterium]